MKGCLVLIQAHWQKFTVGNEDETGKGMLILKIISFPTSSSEHTTPFRTALQCNNYASLSYCGHSCQLQPTWGYVQLPTSEKRSYRGKHSGIKTLRKQKLSLDTKDLFSLPKGCNLTGFQKMNKKAPRAKKADKMICSLCSVRIFVFHSVLFQFSTYK